MPAHPYEAELDDGETLEANRITGGFNYVNRWPNGLEVTTEGDEYVPANHDGMYTVRGLDRHNAV